MDTRKSWHRGRSGEPAGFSRVDALNEESLVVVPMDLSRQHIVTVLRRTGMPDVADELLRDLPETADPKDVQRFCTAHGLSMQSLVERMGGSP
jgi:hypothetical protein